MASVQSVFDTTINLMDEQSQGNGVTMTEDTEEYKFRAISIINAILPTIYPYSGGYVPGQPNPTLSPGHSDEAFSQEVPLEDSLAIGVLPYALASHFLATENEELSVWFMNRYNNAFVEMRSNWNPAEFKPIATPYGLF